MKNPRARGFTLLELMITLALAASILALAVPNMRTFMLNNRLSTAANDLLRGVQVARSEAIKRQTGVVTLCTTDSIDGDGDDLECDYGAAAKWFVFADANNDAVHDAGEDVLARGDAHPSLTVRSDNDGVLCFGPTGFGGVACGGLDPIQNIAICDQRGNVAQGTDSLARAVLVTQTGRARATHVYTEVSAALTAIGAGCP